jgi:hypothetical protein
VLLDEVGLEPGPELRRINDAMLRHMLMIRIGGPVSSQIGSRTPQ